MNWKVTSLQHLSAFDEYHTQKQVVSYWLYVHMYIIAYIVMVALFGPDFTRSFCVVKLLITLHLCM